MPKLIYREEELLREHAYARPQIEAGRRLHGGFDSAGRYLSPRTAVRWEAVRAWQESLRERGGDLLPLDSPLLSGERFPSFAQQKHLLRHGLGQTLWNSLTITGVIEARGRALTRIEAPDFAEVVDEDVRRMAVGHLNRGLLKAHGLDEGGLPEQEIGGHDQMWFAVRDLVFGADAYSDPEIPPTIGRPQGEPRFARDIPVDVERFIEFLMNVLMIEIRAELLFSLNERLLRDPELFVERRDQALQSAVLIDRIRHDEHVHVSYLRTVLGELRHSRFRTPSGSSRHGRECIDPLWGEIVHWHTVESPKLQREQMRQRLHREILARPDGRGILREFEALDSSS
jgi:hypothetical protein